ncbi:hypothetical protein [uncultured Gilvimarinus sp.]|uniref:hypothetical protein n=1 Tax=uncultured Gilvimarinus sp. TaxID=1689143 RepID=UPI0030EC7792
MDHTHAAVPLAGKSNVLFDYPNGMTQNEERELEAFATIDAINDHAMSAIEEMFRHGDMSCYRTTRFEIECVGVK